MNINWRRCSQGPFPILGACFLAVIAHAAALTNGFTNWDDPVYLLNNPSTQNPLVTGVQDLFTTPSIGYPIPITILTYAAQRATFGLDPVAFHTFSLGLHLLVVLLSAVVARRLGASNLCAGIAAALFAVHPLTVEPVAWIVGQKDLLATFLFLAALSLRATPKGTGNLQSLAVFVLTILSLAAKPTTVTAPILLVGIDVLYGRKLQSPRNILLYMAVLLAAAAVTALALWGHASLGVPPTERISITSLAMAGWGLLLQLGHLVWPFPLTARYFPPTGTQLAMFAAGGALVTLLLLAWSGSQWRRGNRAIAYSIVGAFFAYLPASGLVPLTRGPADSYLYLPMALVVSAGALGLDKLRLPAKQLRLPVSVCAITIVLLTTGIITSVKQGTHWRSSTALWHHVADVYPDDPRALMRLGDAYIWEQNPTVAIAIYEQIQRSHPEFHTSRIAHGNILEQLGRNHEAEQILAQGAQTGLPEFLDRYGFFLIAHPTLEPSHPGAASRSLQHIAPLLARRGKREAGLVRAIQLLQLYHQQTHLPALKHRLETLRQRSRP